jgi:hypothetical protein
LAEGARKMRVVTKAAGVGDHAQRLARLHRCAALDKTRSMIQAQRVNEVAVGRTANREKFLEVARVRFV